MLPLPVLRPVVVALLLLVLGQVVVAPLLPVQAPGLVLAELPLPGPAAGLVLAVGPLLPVRAPGLVPMVEARPLPELAPTVRPVELSLLALAVVASTGQAVPLEPPEVPEHSG